MTASTLLLSPVDAWFFRDGRPYNQRETNQADVASLFPPAATTLVGGIRAALARSRGWNGRGSWDAGLNAVLGDGFDNLGSLSFEGPWLARGRANESIEMLFPMPLHVLGKPDATNGNSESSWIPHCLLTPGAEVECDLGTARLPVPSRSGQVAGLKEPGTQWVTSSGLSRVLAGDVPQSNEVVEARDLWRIEARVGLFRDEQTRTTQEGALYSPRFVRLCGDTSVVLRVSGLPEEWHVPSLLALGGEGRMADCRPINDRGLPTAPCEAIRQSKCLTVTLVTPMLPEIQGAAGRAKVPKSGECFLDWLGTKVVSGCVGKSQSLGGWNSLKKSPRPLRPVLPAGSTWFIELANVSQLEETLARHGKCIGENTLYGFGQVALGIWPPSMGDSHR